MRRLVAFVLALTLALQAGVALARSYDHCCDGCQDLAMCLTAACKACSGQAVAPTPPKFVTAEKATETIGYAMVVPKEPVPDIWRPPQRPRSCDAGFNLFWSSL